MRFRHMTTTCILLMSIIVLQTGCISKSSEIESGHLAEDDRLTVYINDFDEIIGPMFEQATGYRVELVHGSGAEIMSRIEAEGNNPHWDVVWADMISSIHGLGVKGLLHEGYVPEHATSLKPSFLSLVPDEKWYYPTGAHAAAVIVYDQTRLTADEAPTSWSDFDNPALSQAIGMADPAIAAPAYSFVSWFFYEHGLSEGHAIMNNWFDNGLTIYPKNPNVAMVLLSGQIKAAALQEDNAYNLIRQHPSLTLVWPDEGAPASVRVAAISRETKHLEAAQAFVNFLLDPKTQQAIIDTSDEAYYEPSAIEVLPKADRHADARLLIADTKWSQEHEAEIKQWFADHSIR